MKTGIPDRCHDNYHHYGNEELISILCQLSSGEERLFLEAAIPVKTLLFSFIFNVEQ